MDFKISIQTLNTSEFWKIALYDQGLMQIKTAFRRIKAWRWAKFYLPAFLEGFLIFTKTIFSECIQFDLRFNMIFDVISKMLTKSTGFLFIQQYNVTMEKYF